MSINITLAGTKFCVPTSLHSLIHRQRLHDLLTTGLRCPLTLLSAPAGYGKTSLLSEWVLTSSMRSSTAWVSLDASDDDPHRFWLCLFLALQQCAPDLIAPLLLLWQDQRTPDIQQVLSLLINRLLEEPDARYVLVIDDYHLMTEPAIHQELTYLIERVPPQLRLVLATRVDPPLPLHRLRARGHLLEVREEHLKCTPAEAAAFLHEVMELSLTGDEIEKITDRTEGWLVGLQLFALSLQGQAPLSEMLTHASGNQRYILDYLTQEVLRQQPEQLQTFLLVTSLFDQFCASLCDALWEEGQSQHMLDMLERMHLFVVALDAEGIWYRYHHLFAEALRHHLHESMPQEEINTLYGKASMWYAEQGQMREAVQYAIQGHNWQHVTTLLERFLRDLRWQPGEVRMMQWWIEQLPAELFDQHPRLGLFAAWLWNCMGDSRASEGWLDRVEISLSQTAEESTHRHLSAELLARRALNKGYYGYADDVILLYEQTRPLLDDDTSYARALLKKAQALAFFARGEAKGALHALQESISAYKQAGILAAACCLSCVTSSYLLLLGQLKQAEHVLDLIQLKHQEMSNQPSLSRGVRYAYQAALLYEQNHLEHAFDLAQQAQHLMRQAGVLMFIDQAYVVLLRIFLASEQFDAAEETLQRLLTLPGYRDNEYAQTWLLSGLQVRLWLATGKQEMAIQWRKRRQQRASLPSPFAQEREAVAQTRVLLAEQRSEEASHLLAIWLPQARSAERWEHVLEMLLLEALAYHQMQREQNALQALDEALAIGEPEGYIRHFLDEGPSLVPLLQRSRRRHPSSYVDSLLDAFGQAEKRTRKQSASSAHDQVLIDPLSAREQEVLEVLAQGASNQEIAQTLVIAPNTVKRHVQTIFAKLGVRNRTQAVTRAQQLDLFANKLMEA
jgi:LuxR family maltose regulon positive regulatory protein